MPFVSLYRVQLQFCRLKNDLMRGCMRKLTATRTVRSLQIVAKSELRFLDICQQFFRLLVRRRGIAGVFHVSLFIYSSILMVCMHDASL